MKLLIKLVVATTLAILLGGVGRAEAQVYRYDYPHAHARSTPGYAVRNPYQYPMYSQRARSAAHYAAAGGYMYRGLRDPRAWRYVRPHLDAGYRSMSRGYYYDAMRRGYVPPPSPWEPRR